ncbi:VOC family protein [Pseudonocardia sp. NPDC049154]|uniref:VOC family protein n=1 Tax=Pseudonocardia sp. NPDC049154 TaxID=3155501 RepID=UPI0033F469B1
MPVELNHTIVAARDKHAAARWLADLLGLSVSPQYGPFVPVETSNGVALDYMDTDPEQITPQHYAFLVTEDEFDAIFARLQQAGVTHYADPGFARPGEINHNDGGRGTYFADPNGHAMEILTVPYGGAPR